ncbi:MAG: hypothetical protein LWW85_02610 [Marinilabiliales bacterium]|nr:hypothetical protein [Marinilabiliales bacterium]
MKTNLKIALLAGSLLITSLLVNQACKKESATPAKVTEDLPYASASVEKNALLAVTSMESVNNFAQVGFISNSLKAGSLSFGSCPSIVVNYTTPPYSITLDWGTACTGFDGISRTGKVEISLNGLMNVANNVATLKIENFVADGNKITGTSKITSAGPNPGNGWPRYDFVTEGKIVFADQKIITFRYEGVTLQAEGASTPTVLADDVWRTEIHSANGVNQDGTTWTAKTTKVMIRKGDCKWYNSGTYEITPSKGDKITLDFGNGTCDNKATWTKGTQTKEISLD